MRVCHISTVHYSNDTRIYFKYIKSSIKKIGNILRIHWIRESLDSAAMIICPKSPLCPRDEKCKPSQKDYNFNEMEDLRQNILLLKKAKLI